MPSAHRAYSMLSERRGCDVRKKRSPFPRSPLLRPVVRVYVGAGVVGPLVIFRRVHTWALTRRIV